MVAIRKYMLKAAGYEVRCDRDKQEIYILDKQENIIATILRQDEKNEVVKWDNNSFNCERAIVDISRGRLLIIAEKGVKTKNPYIECYIHL